MSHLEQHTLSIHYVHAVLHAVSRYGITPEALLMDAGLPLSLLQCPRFRLTPEQISRLMRSGWELTDDEWLGLGSSRCRHGVFTLMAKEAVRCHTLRGVYTHLARFYGLVDGSFKLALKESDDQAVFEMTMREPERDPDHLLQEFLLLLWFRFPGWLIGQTLPLKAVELAYPQPAHAEDYLRFFPCPVRFGARVDRLVIERSILDAPVVQRTHTLKSHLRRAPLDWFSPQAFYSVYTRRILDYLEHRPGPGEVGMEEVAEQLHMTERTLRRKLTLEETSFQRLKDSVRRDQAIHLLSQPTLSVAQISQQLGFSEPTAFTRAFRQWTGYAPRAFRARIGEGRRRAG